MIALREATGSDNEAIRGVLERAFGQPDEARLVEALRQGGRVILELVAEENEQVVGHILYSELPLEGAGRMVRGAALAPLSVDPAFQRRGVGGALIKLSLAQLAFEGVEVLVVLGHPEYYTRFGFSAAQAAGIEHPFPPGPHFMAMELEPGVLDGFRGRAVYAPEFGV